MCPRCSPLVCILPFCLLSTVLFSVHLFNYFSNSLFIPVAKSVLLPFVPAVRKQTTLMIENCSG